jgi:hypothetical protein
MLDLAKQKIIALQQYGQLIQNRKDQIDQKWKALIYGNIFANAPVGKTSNEQMKDPIKNAKISISRSFDWALQANPAKNWAEAKDIATKNTFKKLQEAQERVKQHNQKSQNNPWVFPEDVAILLAQNKIPEMLEQYIAKREKRYHREYNEALVAQKAGSQAVLEMEPGTHEAALSATS